MHECKFTPCTHTHEPHCAVKDALEGGRIDPERYFSYLPLREELK
jgi:ribosome biogenesis GTPase / thiamine phosphate phosphatase